MCHHRHRQEMETGRTPRSRPRAVAAAAAKAAMVRAGSLGPAQLSSADRGQQRGSFQDAGSRNFVSPTFFSGPHGGENLGKTCAGRPEQEQPGVPHHVPGSTVMPIDPVEVLRGLPDLVFRSPTSLGSFAKSTLRSASSDSQSDGNPRGMPRSVWSMPPPYPQVLRENHRSLPEGEFKKLAVDLVVISLNYLDLGRPTRAPITLFGRRAAYASPMGAC